MKDLHMNQATERSPAPLSAGNEHPLIGIPFNAWIDGRCYTGNGLSLTRAQLSGLVDPKIDGADRIVRLIFGFPGFEVILSPVAQVLVVDDTACELVFFEPTGSHSGQLRQILNDFISGDLTSSGGLIRSGSLGQIQGKGAPAPQRGFGRGLQRVVSTLAVVALTTVLIVMSANLMQTRLFTTDIAAPGRVVPVGQTLRATTDGQITFIDLEARAGDVLFALDTVDGETLSVAMPCDCYAAPISVAVGSTVLAGEPLFAVSAEDAQLVIEARLPQELLFEVQQTGGVDVELPGGETFRATLGAGFRAPGAVASDGLVPTTLVPSLDLLPDMDGQVAALSVRRMPFGTEWNGLGTEARAFRDNSLSPFFQSLANLIGVSNE